MNQVLKPLNTLTMKSNETDPVSIKQKKMLKVQSLIYIKQLKKMRTEKGERENLKILKNKLMDKRLKNFRSKQNFEKLYDTSPKRKIIKLLTARVGSVGELGGGEEFRIRKCCVNSIQNSRRGSVNFN